MRPGFAELQFAVQETSPQGTQELVPIARDIVPLPFQNWTFRESELTGRHPLGRVSAQRLDSMSKPLFVRYSSSNTTLADQDEVLVFARDPEEHFRSVFGMQISDPPNAGDSARLRAHLGASVLPNVPAMTYPPDNLFALGTFRGAQLRPQDFWTVANPTGPGAVPAAFGSVKTAKVLHHGVCSQEIEYLDRFVGGVKRPGLLDSVSDGLAAQASEACTGAEVKRIYSNAVPYLHQTTDREDAGGGFVFQAQYDFTVKVPFATSVVPGYQVAYEWRVLDGRLTVEPTSRNSAFKDGTGRRDFETAFDHLFLTALTKPDHVVTVLGIASKPLTIAEVIYAESDKQQQYRIAGAPPINPAGFFVGTTACTPSSPDNGVTTTDEVPADGSSPCETMFLSSLRTFAASLSNVVAPPLTQLEVDRMRSTMADTERSDLLGVPVFKHVHCSRRTGRTDFSDPGSEATLNICEYNVRIKRLNVYPDELELVWLDDDREVANPVYPIFLIDRFGSILGRPAQLCTRGPEIQVNLRPRSYTSSLRDFTDLCK